jgi:hypothetical protein
MSLSRRSFLTESASFGILSTILANPELAHAVTAAATQPQRKPTAGEDYWKTLYSGSTRGKTAIPNEDREPVFVHYTDATGLRWVQDIKPTELPSFTDDAVVTMELSGLRAGSKDTSKLAKVKFTQLHLSCQRVTGSEFIGPLVWAALATAFTSQVSKVPNAQSLSWSALTSLNPLQPSSQAAASALSHMVLNQGAGHMTVAITSTPTTSLLHKILAGTLTATKIMAPLLGFPGIALPALESFYTFYGQLEQALPENFLLNSAKQDIAVTQQGADSSLISVNALKLLTGEYILMPKSQQKDFAQDMDKLVVQNGFLVERDAKGIPDDRISLAAPTVSYITLSVKVQSASTFPATSTVTDPMLDTPPQSTDTPSTASPAKKKPK